MNAKNSRLLVRPDHTRKEFISVTPQSAGWEHLSFQAVKLGQGEEWSFDTQNNELALVILAGSANISSNQGSWKGIGSRVDVFHGLPTTLFLPRNTQFKVQATSDILEFACGWAVAQKDFPAKLITPEEVTIELRGGDNASRQINKMIAPGFPCSRLIVVEVFTPSGNWSSYPPHKHDQRKVGADGSLVEADLEEVYFYKVDRPGGYAYQRVYTDDGSLDELVLVENDHLVLSPEGYHPVVAAQGFNVYYLNFLAGSDQSLASADDPHYAWVKNTWKTLDPRLPLVTLEMNNTKK